VSVLENRYDFVYYFDCQDGNPNGDPDADNSPRIDPETSQGLVSDVCLKRKIRDYVFHSKQESGGPVKGYEVFVLSGNLLEDRQRMPYANLALNPKAEKKEKEDNIARARTWMCENFFDVRAFGAVMSTTAFNCGQVRGPVQLTFARSADAIVPTEHTIFRQAFTGEKDKKESGGTFGKKHTIAYGLYRAHGFLSPAFAEIGPDPGKAKGTGFNEEDLALLWQALGNMFDVDRSAARGLMSARKLVVFKHASRLGEAPAQKLLEMVSAQKRPGVEAPRSFADYEIIVPTAGDLPPGVELVLPF
jgi:CRISPR-associated protein Csd2